MPVPQDYDATAGQTLGSSIKTRTVADPAQFWRGRHLGLRASGRRPVPGDYDGDGKADVARYHASDGTWHIQQSINGQIRVQQWVFS